MKLYIMRHGQAGFSASSDSARPLTERGRQESRLVAKWLAPQIERLDRAIHSPYLRAKETWQTVKEVLPPAHAIEECGDLTPHGDADRMVSYLEVLAERNEAILVVSHLPLVGDLVAQLCATHAPAFHTGSVACVEFKGGRGTLLWIKAPSEL